MRVLNILYKKDRNFVNSLKIMVYLDGSNSSNKGLQTAIKLAKQANAKLVGVHILTQFGAFTAVHTPKLPEKKWPKKIKKIINDAKKLSEKNNIDFGVVLAGHTAGYDLVTFANNPIDKIDQIVVGARGMGFLRELFFGSTSNFILHKAKAPVTVVK